MLSLSGAEKTNADAEAPMKVLTTSCEINGELIRLIRECSSYRVGVAWHRHIDHSCCG